MLLPPGEAVMLANLFFGYSPREGGHRQAIDAKRVRVLKSIGKLLCFRFIFQEIIFPTQCLNKIVFLFREAALFHQHRNFPKLSGLKIIDMSYRFASFSFFRYRFFQESEFSGGHFGQPNRLTLASPTSVVASKSKCCKAAPIENHRYVSLIC